MLFVRMTHKSGSLLRQKYTFFILQRNEGTEASVPVNNLSILSLISLSYIGKCPKNVIHIECGMH